MKSLHRPGNMVALCSFIVPGSNHKVDAAAMARYAAHYDKRMDGLLLGGTTGAGYFLPASELIDGLLRPARTGFSGLLALNVTRECPWETVEIAKRAEGEGADLCVLLVPARTAGMDADGQVAYVEQILKGTKCAWMLYHIPVNGSVVYASTVTRLRHHPQIVRMKCSDSSREAADAFLAAAEGHIAVDMGWDTFIGDWLLEGRNFVCGGSHLLLPQIEALIAAAKTGLYAKTRAANRVLDEWCALGKRAGCSLHALNQFAAAKMFRADPTPPFPISALSPEAGAAMGDIFRLYKLPME